MAIIHDISSLNGKTENDGSTDTGRLTANEWNKLVSAVQEVQNKSEGTIKGIIYNKGPEYGGYKFDKIDGSGYLIMDVLSGDGDVSINVLNRPDTYISSESKCEFTFEVLSKIKEGDSIVSANRACKVSYYIDNGVDERQLVGTDEIYDRDNTTPGVTKQLTFDFAAVKNVKLSGNPAGNKLSIEVNNGYGKNATPFDTTIFVVDLQLQVDFDSVYTETNKPKLNVTVFGTAAKIQAEVDGFRIITDGNATVGTPSTFGDQYFENNGKNVNTHGVHKIKVWATVTKELVDSDPIIISTVPVEYNYIYGTSNTDPIVMATIANKNPEKYTNFNIAYIAYKYNSIIGNYNDTVKTSIYEYKGIDVNGKFIKGEELMYSTENVEFNSETKSTSGSVSFSLFPVTINGKEYDILGDFVVAISIGSYEYLDKITVKDSSIVLREAGNYSVKLSSSGRSNSEPRTKNPEKPEERLVNEWISECNVNDNIIITEMEFDDTVEFIDSGSGWMHDGDKYDINDPNDKGNVALRLKKGSTCTLNYKPFAKNPTYYSGNNNGTNNGLTISIEFATRNSLNQAASVVSCLSEDNYGKLRGFEVLANKATLYSNNMSLYADFKEDTRIKLDIVIEGKQVKYEYDTVSGTGKTDSNGVTDEIVFEKGTSDEALAIIYVDGVYQALATIPEGTSFMQRDGGMPIKFGSTECDIDIYNIRIYDFALSPIQIVDNYSFDTPNVKNKLAIASRNYNILEAVIGMPNKPNINIINLKKARPELPLFFVEMDSVEDSTETLPQDKSAWKLMKLTQFNNPVNNDNIVEDAPSFEIENAVMRNQGTSSMTYPWPWRNWDWKTKDDKFPQGNGKYSIPTIENPTYKDLKYWPQYKNMPGDKSESGIRKITLKKDYASSEMCNNAITSELFTDMANGIGSGNSNVLSLAQRENGGVNSPYRLTFKAIPCFMFRRYSDSTKPGTAGAGVEALGMMNLIPNKNECAYLGFTGNYTWEKSRAQSWELSDNYPEWFWTQKIYGVIRNSSNGSYTNDIDGIYEARYPKDTTVFYKTNDNGEQEADGDFGMVTPKTITENETNAVMNEQSDLIEFHNWLVDCNRFLAEEYKKENGRYRNLDPEEYQRDWNFNEETKTYIYLEDSPKYRLAKFKGEARDHMIVEQFCLYYIWREMFWAYDSGFKNLQIYTMGPRPGGNKPSIMQWGCMVRDADTTLGIQNQGRIEFPPYLEDTDYYVEENGIKTYYFDSLTEAWDESIINELKGKHVLNGQLGALWINLRDEFGDVIEDIYTALSESSNKTYWSANKAIKRFNDHQGKWCESLYNFGMRQYFGGKPFTKWIESGLGDKKNSRASWLQQAFYYRDSKYKVLSDYAAFRAGTYETPDEGVPEGRTANIPLKFKLYQPAWLGLGANEVKMKSVQTHRRVTDVSDYIDVTPAELKFPEGYTSAMNVQFGTHNMIEIGDFARVCKIYEIQDWSFPKLKSLLLGKDPDRGNDGVIYKEYFVDPATQERKSRQVVNSDLKAIELSSMTQLQIIDITNHNAISEEIDMSMCTQLKEIYTRGCTSVTSIKLPATTTLNVVYLPSSITDIKLEGLTGIRKFVLDQPAPETEYSVSSLTISNCGDYLAAESYNIVKQVISSLEKAYSPDDAPKVCTLTNVNWNNADASYLERLLNINATLSGYIKVGALTNDLKVRLIAAYGDIDNPSEGGLKVDYNQEEIENAKLPSKMYFHIPGKYQLKFNVTPADANTYSSALWSVDSNQYVVFATEDDAKNGILTRLEGVADKTQSTTLTVTIKQLPYTDGSLRDDIVITSTIYFYERIARPGDYVFNDGTYSDELDDSKEPIGVCFYVDPKNNENRLMMALESVQLGNSNSIVWGLGTGGGSENNSGQVTSWWGSPQGIVIDGNTSYNCYDIEKISNTSSFGIATVEGANYFDDKYYRDSTADGNNYFKEFIDKSSCLGDIGWKKSANRIEINKLNVNGNVGSIVINKNDVLPSGYINTLAIIEHRNKILDSYANIDAEEFIRPYSDEYKSEFESLKDLCEQADKLDIGGREYKAGGPSTNGSHLYFPAASVAFAYQPNVSKLLDKFKVHNWFLPSSGELVRMCYYVYQSYKDGKAQDKPVSSSYDGSKGDGNPANAFYTAIKDKVLNVNYLYNMNYMLSSSEANSEKYAIGINSNNGFWNNTPKSNSNYIRPICRF